MINENGINTKEKAASTTETALQKSHPNNTFTHYRNQGLSPVPLFYGTKKPAVSWKEYQTSPATLQQCGLWDEQQFNVALLTGKVSGFFALDVDGEKGKKTLAAWIAEHGELPITPMVQTGKGLHYYFLYPDDGRIVGNPVGRSGGGEIVEGIDFRGEGGCIIAPPSLHPNGTHYRWINSLDDVDIAPAPEWLLKIATKPPTPERPLFIPNKVTSTDSSTYALAALSHAAESVATAPEGCRNDTLNREVWSLLRFGETGELRVQDIINTLTAAAFAAGLTRPETFATLMSALRSRGVA